MRLRRKGDDSGRRRLNLRWRGLIGPQPGEPADDAADNHRDDRQRNHGCRAGDPLARMREVPLRRQFDELLFDPRRVLLMSRTPFSSRVTRAAIQLSWGPTPPAPTEGTALSPAALFFSARLDALCLHIHPPVRHPLNRTPPL